MSTPNVRSKRAVSPEQRLRSDENELHPLVALLTYSAALATGVWATWCMVVAFVGGTMPIIGWTTRGSIGFGLIWLIVLEPIAITVVWWATALVVAPISLMLGLRRGPLVSARVPTGENDSHVGRNGEGRGATYRVSRVVVQFADYPRSRLTTARKMSRRTGLTSRRSVSLAPGRHLSRREKGLQARHRCHNPMSSSEN